MDISGIDRQLATCDWSSGQRDLDGRSYLHAGPRIGPVVETLADARVRARTASLEMRGAIAVLEAAVGAYELVPVRWTVADWSSVGGVWHLIERWTKSLDLQESRLDGYDVVDGALVEIVQGDRRAAVVGTRFG